MRSMGRERLTFVQLPLPCLSKCQSQHCLKQVCKVSQPQVNSCQENSESWCATRALLFSAIYFVFLWLRVLICASFAESCARFFHQSYLVMQHQYKVQMRCKVGISNTFNYSIRKSFLDTSSQDHRTFSMLLTNFCVRNNTKKSVHTLRAFQVLTQCKLQAYDQPHLSSIFCTFLFSNLEYSTR